MKIRDYHPVSFRTLFAVLLFSFSAALVFPVDLDNRPAFVPAEFILKLTPKAGESLASGSDLSRLSSELKIIARENQFSPPEPVFRTLNSGASTPVGRPMSGADWVEAIRERYPQRPAPKHSPRPDIDYLYLIRIGGEGRTIPEICRELEALPEVIYAEPNYILEADGIPNDPDFRLMWALDNTGQSGGTPGADIDAREAWEIQKGSRDIVIGVIDTGVDYLHPDLRGNIWVNEGEIGEDAEGKRKSSNGVDDDGNGYVDDFLGWDFRGCDNDPMDDHYHGTAVSGIIAAVGNDSIGIPGVNWTARIMGLKFLDSRGTGSTVDAIRAIEYATLMGADILNNSYGAETYSHSFEAAIQAAYAAGVLFTASAGNNGTNNDVKPRYPSSYDVANVVAVAATDHNDDRAIWSSTQSSNWGSASVDLAAPGKGNYTTSPGDSYRYFSGTSSAAPHIAGVAGIIRAQNPNLSVDEIKDILLAGVDPIRDLGPEGSTPILTGGRINARKCVTMAAAGQNLGQVQGRIIDFSSGDEIAGAGITIIETGQTTRSDFNGLYSLVSVLGNCIVSASAYGFSTQTAVVFIPGGGNINCDFNLKPASKGVLSGMVRDSQTGEGLEATLKIYRGGVCVKEEAAPLPAGEYSTELFEGDYAVLVLPADEKYRAVLDYGIGVVGEGATVLNFDLPRMGFRNVTATMGLGLPAYYDIKGVTWLDYDNDDWLDLYLGADSTQYPNLLFRNDSRLQFEDVTVATGVGYIGRTMTVAAADFDNDGDQDIFVGNWGQNCWDVAENRLFVNTGGIFSEEAASRGLTDLGSTNSAAFGDYNQDGLLDLAIGNSGQIDLLYRGGPSGVFTDANQEAGFQDYGDASGISFSDYDSDGDPDLFIGHANYCSYERYRLLRNDDGKFADITWDSGVVIPGNGFAHGSAWGDYDNDLDPDLYVCSTQRNFLFRNDGRIFTDVTSLSGTGSNEPQYYAAWGDYDNDGDLDLIIPRYGCSGLHSCILYENQGDGTFRDVADEVGLGDIGRGKNVAWADFDQDGDLDLYIGTTLWKNLLENSNNWLQIKLQGSRSNRDGLGAKIYVTVGEATQFREINANGGSQRIAHFGLGPAAIVDRVEVVWPSGAVSNLHNIPADQILKIQEEPFFGYLSLEGGDYDGDGKADIAIFRENIGLWAVRGLGRVYLGGYGDIPVSADYNGDGYTDVGIFRPSSGLWTIKNLTRLYFGGASDLPVPADYDGDGRAEIACFRPVSGLWKIRGVTSLYYGAPGDQPVQGDYSGDGTAEIAIFRPLHGLWAIREVSRVYFGALGDRPLPAAYRWYGKRGPFPIGIGIFRPSTGLWTSRGGSRFYFGGEGDHPLTGDFTGNSLDDVAIFRPASGLWAVRELTRTYFGARGDLPVTR